ncbi:hypothetical protein BDQ17DRAFT_1315427 [Cyathus striatus]|nr:hypothetical protein BDQ17DRAFT_1315427 [Cyathus striatus]
MAPETTPDVKIAAAPFNNENGADLIIRSSDNVQFYVHKLILSLASSFFRDMFSLPQNEGGDCSGSLSTLEMSETSSTVDSILRLCYPVNDPAAINELVQAVGPLQAAIKYQMDEAINIMTERFKRFIPLYPVAVYGLACSPAVRSEILAGLAARTWMNVRYSWSSSLGTRDWKDTAAGETYANSTYIQNATAGQLYRLLECMRSKKPPLKFLVNENAVGLNQNVSDGNRPAVDITRFSDGDIIIRSSDGLDFRAYKIVLQLASKKFLSSIEDEGCVQSRASEAAVPIYCLFEHSSIISMILEICDPSVSATEMMSIGDADVMHDVLRMAMKYDIPKVATLIKSWWSSFAKEDPLQSYFTAVRYGWEGLARQSARATVYSHIENSYTPAMEHAPARSYHNLMQYHHNCQWEMRNVIHTICPRPALWGTLSSLWKADADEPSNKMQWNDEVTAIVGHITKIHSERTDFNSKEYKSRIKLSITELKNKLSAVKLEF